jgi:hypothetical protein
MLISAFKLLLDCIPEIEFTMEIENIVENENIYLFIYLFIYLLGDIVMMECGDNGRLKRGTRNESGNITKIEEQLSQGKESMQRAFKCSRKAKYCNYNIEASCFNVTSLA